MKPIDPTGVARRKVERIGARAGEELDAVVVEEPLEIRVDGETIGVTMRTPGDDGCLALGFLFGEGIIRSLLDVGTVSHCGRPGQDGWGNVIEVRSGPGTSIDADRILEGRRFIPTSSACGVCGRQTIADLIARCGVKEGGATIPAEMVRRCVEEMRKAQLRFEHTGGLHAAAAFDAAGELICCHEDVGRHNAVDKVVGDLLRFGLIGYGCKGTTPALLVVSGRAGFEIVQKAAAAGIAIVASVSAATSLSIDLAASSGLTLIGFARDDSFNIYTHPWRIVGGDGRSRLRAVPSIAKEGGGPAGEGHQAAPPLDREKALVERIRTAGLGDELSALAQAFPGPAAGAPSAAPGRFDTPTGALHTAEEPAAWSVGGIAFAASAVPARTERARRAEQAPRTEHASLAEHAPRTEHAPPEDHASPSEHAPRNERAPRNEHPVRYEHAPRSEPTARSEAEAPPLAQPAFEAPPALDRLVPDAEHGALAVPAAEEARAQECRRSLAAELVERTDQMIRKQRAEGHHRQSAFDAADELDDASGNEEAASCAPGQGPEMGQPRASLEWAPQHEEPRAVLIDDRDPANPEPVYWPATGWSTGRVR